MFLRQYVGECEDQEGHKYELAMTLPSQNMMVRSQAAGRTFILTWECVMDLAKQAGIDEPTQSGSDGLPAPSTLETQANPAQSERDAPSAEVKR